MLIALYLFLVNVVIPQIGAFAQLLLEPVMTMVIILAGIIMLFGVVGLRISNNLGSTIVGGVLGAIGYLFRLLIQAIVWIISNIFRMLPRVFNEARRVFSRHGMNELLSNILAVVVAVGFLIIII